MRLRVGRVGARCADRRALGDQVLDVGSFAEDAEAVDRAIRLWRQQDVGKADRAGLVVAHPGLERVREAEEPHLPVDAFDARAGVGRVTQSRAQTLAFGLHQRDADRCPVGLGGIEWHLHQHGRKIGARLKLALQFEQAHAVVAIARLDIVEAFHQRAVVAHQPFSFLGHDLDLAERESRSAVDLDAQPRRALVDVDIGIGLHQPRRRVVALLYPRQQFGLGAGPRGISKWLADVQFPRSQQLALPRRLLLDGADQADLDVRNPGARPRIKRQQVAAGARPVRLNGDPGAEVALGAEHVDGAVADSAQRALFIVGIDLIAAVGTGDDTCQQRCQRLDVCAVSSDKAGKRRFAAFPAWRFNDGLGLVGHRRERCQRGRHGQQRRGHGCGPVAAGHSGLQGRK